MKREFHVGDKCRIRQWEDMEAEFGLNVAGNIQCKFRFTNPMRPLCGRSFTISAISGGDYYSEEGTEDGWNISADMLELIEDDSDEPIEVPDFLAFLA